MHEFDERIAACRAASTDPRAREALALALRTFMLSVASGYHQLPPESREDAVHDKLHAVLDRVLDAERPLDRPVSFVAAVVRNRMVDELRKQRRQAEQSLLQPSGVSGQAPIDELEAPPTAPARGWAERFPALIEQLRSDDQRTAVRWADLDGKPLQQLVEQDLVDAVAQGQLTPEQASSDRERRKARQRRDKNVQRGRKALQRLVVQRHRHLLAFTPRDVREAMTAVYVDGKSPRALTADADDPKRAMKALEATLARGRRWLLITLLEGDR